MLEAVRQCDLQDKCRIYQASTSGSTARWRRCRRTRTHRSIPTAPYAVAKQYGFWIVKEYREAYGMFCCSGILFNHESERRGETFVTRKITLAAARYSLRGNRTNSIWVSRIAPRLGLCQGLRRVHVVDIAER